MNNHHAFFYIQRAIPMVCQNLQTRVTGDRNDSSSQTVSSMGNFVLFDAHTIPSGFHPRKTNISVTEYFRVLMGTKTNGSRDSEIDSTTLSGNGGIQSNVESTSAEVTHAPGPTGNLGPKHEASPRGVIVGGRNPGDLRENITIHDSHTLRAHVFPNLGVSHFFRHVLPQGNHSTVNPMMYSEEYSQPEGKLQRIERVQHEIAEAQRQREVPEPSTGRHENSIREPSNSLDSEVNRLRSQIEVLARRMEGPEIMRRGGLETQAPPDYYSRSALSTVEC
ncbi:hypothetical protein BDZ94DRAFT_1241793 [Collybia nuda]|uniref:Uncharacterized protein n=1 Tax=Collybia nuda TaxID=64659 RepID=A0A9P5XSU2_9AGAR|nr:hypothetical protein BDZ94DRAFT_1241793 [Collybia nuda]